MAPKALGPTTDIIAGSDEAYQRSPLQAPRNNGEVFGTRHFTDRETAALIDSSKDQQAARSTRRDRAEGGNGAVRDSKKHRLLDGNGVDAMAEDDIVGAYASAERGCKHEDLEYGKAPSPRAEIALLERLRWYALPVWMVVSVLCLGLFICLDMRAWNGL